MGSDPHYDLMFYVQDVLREVDFNTFIGRALQIQQQSLIRRLVSECIQRASVALNQEDCILDTSQETILYEVPSQCQPIQACQVRLNVLSVDDYVKNMRQPKCCIGPKLDDLLKDEINDMYENANILLKLQFNVESNELRKPKKSIPLHIQEMINSSYQKRRKQGHLQCDQCTNTYSCAKSLYCHVRLVHKGEYKYECQRCGKRFLNKHHFSTHVHLHMKILRFQCEVCGRKFVRQPLLTHHLLAEHGSKYQCQHCDKSYTSAKSLRGHLNEIGQEYQCPMCKKVFSTFNSCRRHTKKCQ